MTHERRHSSWRVFAKLIHRLSRQDHLMCGFKRKFLVTTGSNLFARSFRTQFASLEPQRLEADDPTVLGLSHA
jgi:hypothetical protein